MINFTLMGAGRIGKMHAKFIALHPKAKLKYVYDVNSQFAEEVAKSTGCSIASSPEEAINADNIDAVLIASATPTHTQFITMAAKAGKAIFCEKPIDLDIKKVILRDQTFLFKLVLIEDLMPVMQRRNRQK